MTTEVVSPNTVGEATNQSAVPSLDSIAAKMTAMRSQTQRNQLRDTEQTASGNETVGEDVSDPVAPVEPEVAQSSDEVEQVAHDDVDSPDTVTATNSDNSTNDELIDFIEFANDNPNAKFKFVRNGKEVVIDAKKAAAILGQGGAIHEEARQLKIQKAEFDEYLNQTRERQEGLALAMEFTIEPKLQSAYDEIVKTQGYQTVFHQQLQQTNDPAAQARIKASMQQNENYIRQQQQLIGQLKPNVDQFRQIRAQQVSERLDAARKSFQDKELKNEYVYNEVRDKVAKIWPHAKQELIPGVKNIDLISSDENLLALVRDGLKYRDRPQGKSAGSSIAALTTKRGATVQSKNGSDDLSKLRDAAKNGDKKAADNLLVARLQSIRSSRTGR